MNLTEVMKERHSVRQYTDKPLEQSVVSALQEEIKACNQESGLHIQLVMNEPKAFDGFMAHYGKFSGVTNYIAMIGKKGPELDEKCGYYGERLVLKAQQLGLNTCWVAMTYSKVKTAFTVNSGEKLCIVISLGYRKNEGVPHKSKPVEAVTKSTLVSQNTILRLAREKRISPGPESHLALIFSQTSSSNCLSLK